MSLSTCQNGNAAALSRNLTAAPVVAATQFVPGSIKADIQQAQQADLTLQIVYEAVKKPRYRPTSRQWCGTPLSTYYKLWSQLTLCDGVLCRQYTPQPLETVVTIPILPKSLQQQAIQ